MTSFRGKTWIFWAQAIVFGGFALFGLLLGPMFLAGTIEPRRGSGQAPGVALTLWGVAFLAVFAMAAFNIVARRRPIISLHEDSVEFNLIGASSLDGIPLIPGLIRVVWLFISGQGFRRQSLRIPRTGVLDVKIFGPPMARVLAIAYETGQADDPPKPRIIQFREVAFRDPIHAVADAIFDHCLTAEGRVQPQGSQL